MIVSMSRQLSERFMLEHTDLATDYTETTHVPNYVICTYIVCNLDYIGTLSII